MELTLSTKGISLKVQTYEDLVKEKQEAFEHAMYTMSRKDAITYMFENFQHCRFIVFQSRHTPHYFQFGNQRSGYFLDYVVNKLEANKKNLQRTVNYLNAKGFHEVDVDTWEYKGYFFERNGKLKCIDACFKRDILLIIDCVTYLTVEVYKEDFSDFRVICG